MNIIERAASALSTGGALLLIVAMGGVVTADVLIRSITGRGLTWALDLTSMLLVAFFFATLPWSLRVDAHVRMDIFYLHFPRWLRLLSNLLGAFGAMLFFGAIGWRSLLEAPHMAEFGVASPTVGIPYWPIAVFVALCCALALAVLLALAFGRLRNRAQ
jgi:TRAP-type C4-dicarboxylate transport system permease small subunit